VVALETDAALISTPLLMGIATFLVAFVPTYGQIGIWGAVLLPILRFIQGVGVGGARMDLCSGSSVHDSARYDVRAAGRADRRILHRTVALQRGVNGLSAGFCNCRWAGPVDRGVAVRAIWIGLHHCCLYSALFDP
jgi:MFS family permease